MKAIEQFLDLVIAFTPKRWFSLLVVLATLGGVAWVTDYYTSFSVFYRMDKSVGLLERLAKIESSKTSPEVDEIKTSILYEIALMHKPSSPPAAAAIGPKQGQLAIPWYSNRWAKLLSGAAPWFLISLFALVNVGKDKSAIAAFFALQVFTILFGFVNYWIPQDGRFWVDHLATPLAIFLVLTIIPISIASVAAVKKVRDSSVRKSILNNLRQLSAAADQFYLEMGQAESSFDELVGPDRYIKSIVPVDGERYDLIEFRQGKPLSVVRKTGEVISYGGEAWSQAERAR